ncbi:hypothetical protein ELI24_32120 (plasmid) [Rhizobium ruizarguesonis]|uniref:hypothetical protein n=1 Tax=Rhizobium ruizarguesonis TaxID=2081791 RepID=UPI00102F4FC6|nr:hypothetical protein [Rhizobium ruizarguesonis]TAU15655.1 hypothetical protein ELI48_32160 [Rhizobium ruizarguesonis]TAV86418.1 hypothetical protein ELI24_32120 [Rhizobium ruizarguesonis]TAW03534.1 hypothetical protein ELI26_32725 [Rhizobium ruizarguesonis]TAW85578.1 hypothetical protein ELI12_30730 [Rhizobium ruizarguesonis]
MNSARNVSQLDFSSLSEIDARNVREAIARGDNFQGYVPSEALGFIVRNYLELARLRSLEAAWVDCYVHSSNFDAYGVETVKAIFDACDRERLRSLKPLTHIAGKRATLFRGCAGPRHTLGMSWTSSLDKAIWCAVHHAEYYDLSDCAVYVAIIPTNEIYCCLDHYDHDCIAYPQCAWRVDVPASEYRLDRMRADGDAS